MRELLRQLMAAGRILENAQESLDRRTVLMAAQMFNAALEHRNELSSQLAPHAEPLEHVLLRHGTLEKTFAVLTDAEVWHVAGLILDFVRRVENQPGALEGCG